MKPSINYATHRYKYLLQVLKINNFFVFKNIEKYILCNYFNKNFSNKFQILNIYKNYKRWETGVEENIKITNIMQKNNNNQ